jgi:hypothetical protein
MKNYIHNAKSSERYISVANEVLLVLVPGYKISNSRTRNKI